jgi:hypothetical protein
MDDSALIEIRLRAKISRFLKKPGRIGAAVSILKDWEQRGWSPVLFGGTIRDLVVLGLKQYPRDIDIVLNNVTIEQVRKEFRGQDYKLNRFGGMHLNIARWSFDVWPLEKTWAFTVDHSLAPVTENLPKTTFLDVEAVAATFDSAFRLKKIYSYGFFEAIANRCIDINYADNPFPALCAIRTVITASKLRFKVSSRLASYFIKTVQQYGRSDLIVAQKRHYNRIIFDEEDLTNFIIHFESSLHSNPQDPVRLPYKYDPEQLKLWN